MKRSILSRLGIFVVVGFAAGSAGSLLPFRGWLGLAISLGLFAVMLVLLFVYERNIKREALAKYNLLLQLSWTIFDMAGYGDYSNGNEADGGIDEGRVRAREMFDQMEKTLSRYGDRPKEPTSLWKTK
jgi:hypothetical protein